MNRRILGTIFLCIALVIIAFIMGTSYEGNQRQLKTINTESELRVDINSTTHNFTEWIYKAQGMTSDILWDNGVKNLFSIKQLFIVDLSMSLKKDADGFFVDTMSFSTNFSSGGYNYTQGYSIIDNGLTSNINKSPNNSLEKMDGVKLQSVLSKMDRLDLAFFINKLPSSDYYSINYYNTTTVIAKSTESVQCYLVGTNGEIEQGSKTEEKRLGPGGAHVLALSTIQRLADGTSKPIGRVDIYLLN